MPLLSLDDDSLFHVVDHSRDHSAFTILVCRRLRDITKAVFRPMPVTCSLASLMRRSATFAVYSRTKDIRRAFEDTNIRQTKCAPLSSFKDAVIRYGDEDFVSEVVPDWTEQTNALICAGRVDLLRKIMEPTREADALGARCCSGKNVHPLCCAGRETYLRDIIRYLSENETLTALPTASDAENNAKALGHINSVRAALLRASEAPGPETLGYIFDLVYKSSATEKTCTLDLMLVWHNWLRVSILRAAIKKGGGGNIDFIQQQVQRCFEEANSELGADEIAESVFLWVCASICSSGEIGYGAWHYLERVDWKARGYTLESVPERFRELQPFTTFELDHQSWYGRQFSISMFNIRDVRSMDIVTRALDMEDSWLTKAFRKACPHASSIESLCLFQIQTDGCPANVHLTYRCTNEIALRYVLHDDTSSCYVTGGLFKITADNTRRELSGSTTATYYSSLLILSIWSYGVENGTSDSKARAYKILYDNNFVLHTLVKSFALGFIGVVDELLDLVPNLTHRLSIKQRMYVVQRGCISYEPARMAKTAAKIALVSQQSAYEMCCQYATPPGKRRLPDFDYRPSEKL